VDWGLNLRREAKDDKLSELLKLLQNLPTKFDDYGKKLDNIYMGRYQLGESHWSGVLHETTEE
jgi:hypothetical protein